MYRNWIGRNPRFPSRLWADVHVPNSLDDLTTVLNSSNNAAESLNRALNRLVPTGGALSVANATKALTLFKRQAIERLIQLRSYDVTPPSNRESTLSSLIRLQYHLELKKVLNKPIDDKTKMIDLLQNAMRDFRTSLNRAMIFILYNTIKPRIFHL